LVGFGLAAVGAALVWHVIDRCPAGDLEVMCHDQGPTAEYFFGLISMSAKQRSD
jgi:hypothetical protein